MFMGPLGESKPWNPRDVSGSRRFLDRIWRVFVDETAEDVPLRPNLLAAAPAEPEGDSLLLERALNKTLVRIEDSFGHFNFNTAIAAMMEFINEATKNKEALTRSQAERFVCALAPFAPHLAEELWSRLGHGGLVAVAPWPRAEAKYLVEDRIELVVQVNGKLRGRVAVAPDAPKDVIIEAAKGEVSGHIEGKELRRTVVVPGRLVNFVV